MGALLAVLTLLAPTPEGRFQHLSSSGNQKSGNDGVANLLLRETVVGHSLQGRAIKLREYGEAAWSGELLVFGCIHGDECAASGISPTTGGCPDPSADIYFVPHLNPDGARAGSRLNGRGVDLNRNFPSRWRPIGERWDPQYSGPHPFSEPETRLAARIVRALRPAATIWFHQYRGSRPFVRAWGASVGAGRRFARLGGIAFRPMPWPAGTAPNWQNHRFPGAASFVVELPRGRLGPLLRRRLGEAVVRMGRWVRED
jgi:murein peptide amidase A